MKQRFYLALAKKMVPASTPMEDLSYAINAVDLIWSGECTMTAARKRFSDLVMKQLHEYRDTKTLDKWRVVLLYDSHGQLVMRES